jgi:hypothetical protein
VPLWWFFCSSLRVPRIRFVLRNSEVAVSGGRVHQPPWDLPVRIRSIVIASDTVHALTKLARGAEVLVHQSMMPAAG